MAHIINNIKIRTKTIIMLVVCIIVPLVTLESVISYSYYHRTLCEEKRLQNNLMERLGNYWNKVKDELETYANYIYFDEVTYDFLYTQYKNKEEYQTAYDNYQQNSISQLANHFNKTFEVSFYTDNKTIDYNRKVNDLSHAKNQGWYKAFLDNKRKQLIYSNDIVKMEICIVVELNYYSSSNQFNLNQSKNRAICKIDLNIPIINENLKRMIFNDRVYVFRNNLVVFTNSDEKDLLKTYEEITKKRKLVNITDYSLEDGEYWSCYVVSSGETNLMQYILKNRTGIIILLLLLILPIVIMLCIQESFVTRITILKGKLDRKYPIKGQGIQTEYGSDEIGQLLWHYENHMRYEHLLLKQIQKESEEKIALGLSKKQAEINALMSQANPHFLYNSLECICMRCLIKGENDTAEIIRYLTSLLREMSNWQKDQIELIEELEFVRRYLKIQQYRFGDKIKYHIKCDKECESFVIPKLSIITFVENAFVHGIENSLEDGEIRIEATCDNGTIIISIKDNGAGMNYIQKKRILEKVRSVTFETFETAHSTGIMNAYLRLKLAYGERFLFNLESEIDEGTSITLGIKNEEESNV